MKYGLMRVLKEEQEEWFLLEKFSSLIIANDAKQWHEERNTNPKIRFEVRRVS